MDPQLFLFLSLIDLSGCMNSHGHLYNHVIKNIGNHIINILNNFLSLQKSKNETIFKQIEHELTEKILYFVAIFICP